MTHRAGGGLVLLLAVLSLLVVPRVLSPPAVTGTARIEPPEPPPAVGTCLAGTPSSYGIGPHGTVTIDRQPDVVPCTAEHDGEVVYVAPSVDRSTPATDTGTSVDQVMADCYTETDDLWGYLGHPPRVASPFQPGAWTTHHMLWTTLLGPDATQRDHGARWVACVAGVTDDTVHVPLRDLVTRSGGIPPELGWCYPQPPDNSGSGVPSVPCSSPHRVEVLGTTPLDVAGDTVTPVDGETLLDGCRRLALDDTRRTDLPTDPLLAVELWSYLWSETDLVTMRGIPTTLPADTQGGWAECVITVTDPDRRLTGSLRLIGDAPLPWA